MRTFRAAALALSLAGTGTGRAAPPPAGARQLILVVSPSWESVPATQRRFERAKPGKPWRAVGAAVPVSLGRSGLGWGSGVHPPQPGGPVKKEGDGRAPAGAYKLGSAFGYEKAESKLPFVVLTNSMECVDDVKSAQYNRLIDRAKIAAPDWQSSEQMLRKDTLYRLGIVVEHNTARPVAGDGSCIFLHIREKRDVGTAGCTAMEPENIAELIKWIDPKKAPLLVQLPQSEYARLAKDWSLPPID